MLLLAMMRDLVSSDPSVSHAAWERMHDVLTGGQSRPPEATRQGLRVA